MFFFFAPEVMKEVHNLTKLKKKHKEPKLHLLWAGTKKIQQHRLRRFNDSPFLLSAEQFLSHLFFQRIV